MRGQRRRKHRSAVLPATEGQQRTAAGGAGQCLPEYRSHLLAIKRVEKATGWGLDADDARWFAEQWVPDPALRADPRVSPLRETDLGGLAPAIVVTAEHDVLRDEGNAYATALAAAGVPVTHRCEAGLVHGFLSLDVISPVAAEPRRERRGVAAPRELGVPLPELRDDLADGGPPRLTGLLRSARRPSRCRIDPSGRDLVMRGVRRR